MKTSPKPNTFSYNTTNKSSARWLMVIWSVSFHLLLLFGIVAVSRPNAPRKPITNFVNARLLILPASREAAPSITKTTPVQKPSVIEKAPTPAPKKKEPDIVISPKKKKTTPRKQPPKQPTPKKSENKPRSTAQEGRDIGGVFQSQHGMPTIDIHSLHYTWYQSIVTNILRSNWATSVADAKSIDIKVLVSFYIQRNGSIADVKLMEPSGVFILDQAVLRAVMNSNPLPPLPAEFKRDKLYAQYEFVY